MFNILRAEWQKMVGNKWTTGLLIWLFPAGAFGFVSVAILIAFLSPNFRDNITPLLWTDNFLEPWDFASNLFGRTFLLGFTAVTFAGEYQWGTWKNIVPRQRRSLLIFAKFINVSVLILLAFGLMSIIFGFGYGVLSQIADVTYGPEVTKAVIQKFSKEYALQATLTFLSVMIASVYAALSALLMQSILGGIIVGIGISVAEPLIIPGSLSLANMFDKAVFLHLGRFTPYYNIENISSWVRNEKAVTWLTLPFERFKETAPVDSMSFSVWVLSAWLILGIGLVLVLFQRQDITT